MEQFGKRSQDIVDTARRELAAGTLLALLLIGR